MSIHPDAFVHELAYVEDGATLGRGSKVWPFAQVRGGAVVGEDTNLGKGCFLDEDAKVGDRCKIGNNVNVHAGIEIGDEVFVGPSAQFSNDMYPRAQNADWVLLRTIVGDGASIGANASIAPGLTIGAAAMIGIGSTVTRNVEDHELVVGNPARRLGWVCDCGKIASRDQDRPADLRCDDCAAE